MSKAVLISIRPKWCEKIVLGEKTIEVRKTRPKMDTPFKCYIYCTRNGQDPDRLWVLNDQARKEYDGLVAVCANLGECQERHFLGNGKVIGEFVCYRIDALARVGYMGSGEMPRYNILNADARIRPAKELFQRACLTEDEAEDYLKDRYGFGWHISDLKIYDEPKELSEFTAACRYKNDDGTCPSRRIACSFQRYDYNPDGSINIVECGNTISRPPQSWGYVEELP